MKKRLILKILLSFIFIISMIISIAWIVYRADLLIYSLNNDKEFVGKCIGLLLLDCIPAITSLIGIIIINFKDISYICGSLFKDMQEYKESTAEDRKQKRIESLEKELEELKSDSNKDNM